MSGRPSARSTQSPRRLVCATCGKATRAKHADILKGWYRGEDGARYCSWECTGKAPKPKRGRPLFVKMSLPGATTPADVDRWMETVVAPAVTNWVFEVLTKEQERAAAAPKLPERAVIREFVPRDYAQVFKLWKASDGVVLTGADERQAILGYLRRNRGMSFVREVGGSIVGAVLCGTDGRRGFLHHLAVAPEHQRQGLGKALVAQALGELAKFGIEKCHLMVLPTNSAAREFWKALGWHERTDVLLMSRRVPGEAI